MAATLRLRTMKDVTKKSKSVLAIGMVDSIHFARWLNGISGIDASVTIFPSGPNRKIHARISALAIRKQGQFSISSVMSFFSLPIWLLDKVFVGRIRACILFFLLSLRKYDIIHFHEMQSGGYPLSLLPKKLLLDSRICYTPYGSDMFWFMNSSNHKLRIRRTIQLVDVLFPECERDGKLARDLGFSGEIGPRMAAGGPFQFQSGSNEDVDSRKIITVKGYGGTWGRAVQALESLHRVQGQIAEYEIHVVSVTSDVQKEIARLLRTSNLNIIAHPKFSLSTSEVRTLLMRSKYYIALSESDGFPASLMEALLCGCIPIQSSTACIPDDLLSISPDCFLPKEEWVEVGERLVALDSGDDGVLALSNRFSSWAREQQMSPDDFKSTLSRYYGVK